MPSETNELKEITAILTDIRISLAKLETTQQERSASYDKIHAKFEELETDVQQINKNLAWASGFITMGATVFSLLINTILKKAGIA